MSWIDELRRQIRDAKPDSAVSPAGLSAAKELDELRGLLIVYGWEPKKEGAATWLMGLFERLHTAEGKVDGGETR